MIGHNILNTILYASGTLDIALECIIFQMYSRDSNLLDWLIIGMSPWEQIKKIILSED